MNRNTTLLLALLLATSLAVVPGSVAGGTGSVAADPGSHSIGSADAAADYDTPENVCTGDPQRLVVLLENGDVKTDEVALFEGTSFRVVLCTADGGESTPEPTDAWGLTGLDAFEQVTVDSHWIQLRATARTNSTDLSMHLDGRAGENTGSPTVAVRSTGGTSTGYLGQPETVYFFDEAARRQFETGRDEYEGSVTNARDLAKTLEAGADSENPIAAVDRSVLVAYDERLASLESASDTVEDALLTAAVRGNGDATAAYLEHRKYHTEERSRLEESLAAYLGAVEEQAGAARLTVTGVLLGTFVVGIGVGGVIGRAVSLRDLKRIRRKRRRDSTVDYRLGNLWKVFLGAVLALVGSLGVLVAGPGIELLFEVVV
ncbi:hypothetical protein [Haloparvum sp. PAK95]|uniref:hypothetical protein n=1 Tax=Haloparvum sp. PAK95 TaxID=3418962 RepID=UPI003D2EC007